MDAKRGSRPGGGPTTSRQLREHDVLNGLIAQLQTAGGHYWRDKQGHEVDLIPLAAREKSDGQRMQMVRS